MLFKLVLNILPFPESPSSSPFDVSLSVGGSLWVQTSFDSGAHLVLLAQFKQTDFEVCSLHLYPVLAMP